MSLVAQTASISSAHHSGSDIETVCDVQFNSSKDFLRINAIPFLLKKV